MRKVILIGGFGMLATACGGGPKQVPVVAPETLYQQAMADYRRGDCKDASDKLQRASFQLTMRDSLQGDLQYYLAECQYADHQYLEAARQFRRVADDAPRHRLAPDALLRAGDAFAELWKNPALDPTYGQNAIDVWRELMGRYPQTPAAERARLRMAALNEKFAEKDYKNGVFYQRLRAFDSAIIYFQDLVAKYPQTSYAPRAVTRLIEIYARIGYTEERQEMCEHLRRFYTAALPDAEACSTAASSP